jgi:hypothetical protein
MQLILLCVTIRTPKILHQPLDRRGTWHEKLDVIVGIPRPERLSPRRSWPGLKDVDLGMFCGKCIVVSWRESHASCMVPQMDRRKHPAGHRCYGWIGLSAPAWWIEVRERGLSDHGRHCHRSCNSRGKGPLREGKGGRLGSHGGILHALWLRPWESWRRRSGVKAVEGIKSSTDHGVGIGGCDGNVRRWR